MSDLAKYSMTQSIARLLCDSWASCHCDITGIDSANLWCYVIQYFYRATRMHSADYAVANCLLSVRPSVCPFVCLSVTRRYSVETATNILILFSPEGIARLDMAIFRRVTPNGRVKCKGLWWKKITSFDQYLALSLELMQDRVTVTMESE